MKTIITIASLAISSLAMAQDNYTIKSAVSVEGLPAEQAAFGEMESTTYIKGDKMKMELSSMMYNMTVANDGEKTFMLQEVMGEKSGFYMTKAESEAEEKEAAAKEDKNKPKPKIVVTTDKKMIAGFEATKAFVYNTKKDGKNVAKKLPYQTLNNPTAWCGVITGIFDFLKSLVLRVTNPLIFLLFSIE